jgi:hypothetical protein
MSFPELTTSGIIVMVLGGIVLIAMYIIAGKDKKKE